MKQLILNALKAKFTGVSDQILDRIANKLAQTVTQTEQVQTVVDGVTFQQVLESYGDSRATQAQQTAVHNYEQKYGLKDGVKIETQQQQQQQQQQDVQNTASQQQQGGGAQQDVPAWAQALIDSNKQLSERLNRMDTERTTATRRQQIDKLVESLPENFKKAYSRTPLDGLSDDQFNTLVTEITAEVGSITSEIKQRGAVYGKPTAQGGNQNGNELTAEQVKAIENRGFGSGNQPF